MKRLLIIELSGRIIELAERRGTQFETSIINGSGRSGFSRDFVGNRGNVTLCARTSAIEIKLKKERRRKRRKMEGKK